MVMQHSETTAMLSSIEAGQADDPRFTMKFAEAPPGGFASSYEKQQTKNFAFLIPGDEELFVGGGALNGAVGKLLFEHANQPIQFCRAADGKYETVVENGKDVPKFTKDTCPYRKTQEALFAKGLAKKETTVVADASEIGDLPVVFSCGRTYSDCDHPFGSAFLHVFKDSNCPFGVKQNAALLYCVGALGINAKAPGEGAPDPARLAYVKSDVQDFLYEIFKTGESTVQLVLDYNKQALSQGLPVLEVIRLPVVSGGIFLHPDITPKEAALALIWGVHKSLARNSAGSSSLAIELMPGKPMEEAYKDYSENKKPDDWNTPSLKNIFAKIHLEEFKSIVGDYRDILPEWAYHPDVAKLADSPSLGGNGIPVPMGCAVGPAIQWARLGILFLWPPMVMFFYIAYTSSHCVEGGYSVYPDWIWLVFLPFCAVHVFIEFQCLRYCILPFVQVVGPLKMFGVSVSFNMWLAAAYVQAILNLADNGTDSLFLATTIDSQRCDGSEMAVIWREVLNQSALVSWVSDVDIVYFIALAYGLSFLQLLFPLLESTARFSEPAVDYVVGTQNEDGTRLNQGFTNCWGSKMNLGDTLYILGEANLMASLQLHNPSYPRGKFDLIYSEAVHKHKPQDIGRLLSFARNALSRGLVRIGLVALLENSVQINLQVSLMAITRATQPVRDDGTKDVQPQMILSIGLSICMMLIKIKEASELLSFKWDVMAKIPETANGTPEEKSQYSSLRLFERGLYLMLVALVFMLSWATLKLYKCFTCEDSLWNFGSGCVDLGAVLTKLKH